jgi:competence protein ComGC
MEFCFKMKRIMPFLIVLVIISIIVGLFLSLASKQQMIVVQGGNFKRLPLVMQVDKYQDSDCGMVINDLKDASQVIAPDGKTWFFHDHGGLVHWLEDKSFKDDVKVWVKSRDTKKWIDAKDAFYSLTDKTAMGFGFGAYENKSDKYVDFDTMRLKMLRGETLKNPLIKKQLLGL